MWGKEGRSMTDEAKAKMMQGVFQGADLSHAQINMVVESGATVNYYGNNKNEEKRELTDERLAEIVNKSQTFWYSKSSWAVVYCYCRDNYNINKNVSLFERRIMRLPLNLNQDYIYTEGTINRTINNNSYMKMNVTEWNDSYAKERTLKLLEEIEKIDEAK
ncbi:MAG: hypothetical protein IJ891_01750 [Prevotella sp.]|nr:hypothetical protein [Prevotella sp.]